MAPKPMASGAPGPSAGKRKAATGAPNARGDASQQKRAKIMVARNIPAQPAEAALKDGELDLQAFVAAHEFEIRSLEQSMATSKAMATSRAFQQVPRGMRRRTASHNPKRVPRRLRPRAKREMAEDNTPTVEARRRKPRTSRARLRAETARKLAILALRKKKKRLKAGSEPTTKGAVEEGIVGRKPRPKVRRNQLNEPQKPTAKFRKRQINKTWLPTHLWHTKRARMTEPKNPLWRFAVPLTPNEKVYRPTHRAQGDRGTLAWDMSYMSTIGIYGQSSGLERVLKNIGVTSESCWNDKGKNWRAGTRVWNGLLSRNSASGQRSIGPATILWNPEHPSSSENQDTTTNKTQRQVFVRLHPSIFLESFNELLRLVRSENPKVYIEDLRFEIGSLELTGPSSTEALLAILTPYPDKERKHTSHGRLFSSLKGLTNPASLPANSVLGFPVQDPRLRYPPRRVEAPEDESSQMKLLETISEWPVHEGLEPFGMFDRDVRWKAASLPSQKSLSRRKSRAQPGKLLEPTSVDPPIPVVLVASRSGSSIQAQGTWTLLAPWKCILPLWYSLVHTPLTSGSNPQFAGLNESMQVAFEKGLPWFPADYLGTDAGAQWELDQRAKRRREWDRKPKSKRIEWTSLDLGAGRKGEVGDGLACDFEFLFKLPSSSKGTSQASTDPPETDAMEVDNQEAPPSANPPNESALSLITLNHIPKTSFNALLAPSPSASPPSHAIIIVEITVIGRGVVKAGARVYRLPTKAAPAPVSSNAEVPASIPPEGSSSLPHDLRAQWLARASPAQQPPRAKSGSKVTRITDLETRKRLLAQELTAPPSTAIDLGRPNQHDIGGHPLVPDVQDLVGFVTSGTFSLSKGRGVAIASLAVDGVLPGVRGNAKEGHLCVVRNAGENVGWVARWAVI
ncbi:Ribonucleases P/MRP protein subunit pop1 [Paramyrothecium foliicola]|nr:Ribonucleases P/MRP protein subunit pop1 [Paramyrothecium foliicola]